MGNSSLTVLLEGHWYDAVAALLERSLPAVGGDANLLQARELAAAARRVLDLDAEDFSTIAHGFRAPWAGRLADSSFPLEPRDPVRGALGSLVGLYELMLEVLELRAARREPLQIVVTAHLLGEYLVQLAWEPTLGHGGDPLRMADSVLDSRWGTDDPSCAHSSALRSTAKRALNAANGDTAGYTAYLDRFHSRLGEALGVCAMNHATVGPGERPDVGDTCPDPCGFVTRPPMEQRRDLDARVRLAKIYADSPIVALRHHAPVGHFFGVPSVQEISEAWIKTWEKVSQPWADGANPLLISPHGLVKGDAPLGPPQRYRERTETPSSLAPSNEALPGMSALVSAVAGRPIGPGHLVRDIGADIARCLSSTGQGVA